MAFTFHFWSELLIFFFLHLNLRVLRSFKNPLRSYDYDICELRIPE